MRGNKHFVILFALAFVARFGFGWLATTLLPSFEAGSEPQRAGYLFYDAYHRDNQAYDLAKSNDSLLAAFNQKRSADQYGGMLWLMALIYRLATNSHQPLIPQFFISFLGASGVIFIYLAFSRLFTRKTAIFASIAFALYPESVLLGAAQMREPLLITFGAIIVYAISRAESEKFAAILWAGFALIGSLFISPGIALLFLTIFAGWFVIDKFGTKLKIGSVLIWSGVFIILVVAALAFLILSWEKVGDSSGFSIVGDWVRRTALYNAHLLKQSSGIVQVVIGSLPSAFVLPFVVMYGTIQPVLPAVLFEPGELFWKVVGFFRALGWYALLPLILSVPLDHSLPKNGKMRLKWLWIFIVSFCWILIAAARGGGDQWDNPRYRTILLPFFLILAFLTLTNKSALRGKWLRKILWIEISSILIFTHWYSWRYTGFGFDLGIRNTILIAIMLALFIAFGDYTVRKIRGLLRL